MPALQAPDPKIVTIYDPYFWAHERHWKLSESPITRLFSGTPFRPMMLRAMGMKIGRKVFDCSRSITERTLTEVGDYANLNEGAVLQAHSLEEGVFKSDISASATAARSAPARSCITASPWATMSCSTRIRS